MEVGDTLVRIENTTESNIDLMTLKGDEIALGERLVALEEQLAQLTELRNQLTSTMGEFQSAVGDRLESMLNEAKAMVGITTAEFERADDEYRIAKELESKNAITEQEFQNHYRHAPHSQA